MYSYKRKTIDMGKCSNIVIVPLPTQMYSCRRKTIDMGEWFCRVIVPLPTPAERQFVWGKYGSMPLPTNIFIKEKDHLYGEMVVPLPTNVYRRKTIHMGKWFYGVIVPLPTNV
jgi:hypothetical protein